jgi:hypothetical protein
MIMDDPVDSRVASALEQFGAELEAIFIGPPPQKPAAAPPSEPKGATPSEKPEPVRAPEPPVETLGIVETELAEILMQEGIVVRGIDVARVVAVATGREVTWAA